MKKNKTSRIPTYAYIYSNLYSFVVIFSLDCCKTCDIFNKDKFDCNDNKQNCQTMRLRIIYLYADMRMITITLVCPQSASCSTARMECKLCLTILFYYMLTYTIKQFCYCFFIYAMETLQSATDGVSAGLETRGVVSLVFLPVACCHAMSEPRGETD